MLNWLTQAQHGSRRSRTERRRHKLRGAAGHERWSKRRYDSRQLWHFGKLARGQEFNVVALMADALVHIEQRKSQHPDRSEHDVAALQDHLIADRIPGGPGTAEWR